jgi:hypothetical protein
LNPTLVDPFTPEQELKGCLLNFHQIDEDPDEILASARGLCSSRSHISLVRHLSIPKQVEYFELLIPTQYKVFSDQRSTNFPESYKMETIEWAKHKSMNALVNISLYSDSEEANKVQGG